MGRSKSPVDELVDGIDAIGSILDENLPQIKSRIDALGSTQEYNNNEISAIQRSVKVLDEASTDLSKTVTSLDTRVEEVINTIGALARRLDQLQQAIHDLTLNFEKGGTDMELSDSVKVLEDRLRRLESDKNGSKDPLNRY